MNECKLELHPVKTKIVYCKDANMETAIEGRKRPFGPIKHV